MGGQASQGQLGQFDRLQVEDAGFIAPQHLRGQCGQRGGGQQGEQPFDAALAQMQAARGVVAEPDAQHAAQAGADGQHGSAFLVVAQPGGFGRAQAQFQLRQQAGREQYGAGGGQQRQAAGQRQPQQQRDGSERHRAGCGRRKAQALHRQRCHAAQQHGARGQQGAAGCGLGVVGGAARVASLSVRSGRATGNADGGHGQRRGEACGDGQPRLHRWLAGGLPKLPLAPFPGDLLRQAQFWCAEQRDVTARRQRQLAGLRVQLEARVADDDGVHPGQRCLLAAQVDRACRAVVGGAQQHRRPLAVRRGGGQLQLAVATGNLRRTLRHVFHAQAVFALQIAAKGHGPRHHQWRRHPAIPYRHRPRGEMRIRAGVLRCAVAIQHCAVVAPLVAGARERHAARIGRLHVK